MFVTIKNCEICEQQQDEKLKTHRNHKEFNEQQNVQKSNFFFSESNIKQFFLVK